MARHIVLDTETTGLSYAQGHKLVEVGCVEVVNNLETGEYYHCYINPCCEMDSRAAQIHGLTSEFLADKPKFGEIAEDFLAFVGDSCVVAHNASFDIGFLNHELGGGGFRLLDEQKVIDTLAMARKKFFRSSVSLNALCKRFGISTEERKLHGALLDARLLAKIYLAMVTGDQGLMNFNAQLPPKATNGTLRPLGPFTRLKPSEEECLAHRAMLEKVINPIWEDC